MSRIILRRYHYDTLCASFYVSQKTQRSTCWGVPAAGPGIGLITPPPRTERLSVERWRATPKEEVPGRGDS